MSSMQGRLPTFDELSSLLWGDVPLKGSGLCKQHELLETAYATTFENCRHWYWSSDVLSQGDKIRVVDFRDGFAGFAGKANIGRARLVSSIKTQHLWKSGDCAGFRYEVLQGGIVKDKKTGLLWQQSALQTKLSFEDVLALRDDAGLIKTKVA